VVFHLSMMVTILGIHDGHDAGAALIKDDEIHAVNEERLSREKYHRGFPKRSIKEVLELSSTDPADIDLVAAAGIYRKKKRLLQLKKCIKEIIGEPETELLTVHHHLAHSAGAYFTSGWKKCLVLTIDAAGDGVSSAVFIGDDGELKKIAESSYLDSVGDFYASITEMLGFVPMRHEGKIMALSGYHQGEDDFGFEDCIEVSGLGFKNHLEVTGSGSVKKLSEKTGFPLKRKKECSNVLRSGKKDHELWDTAVKIAGSAQHHLENMLEEWCENIKKSEMIQDEFKKRVCFVGGVAQNVKANKVIKKEFPEYWIFPHMGDGGLALGAALQVKARLDKRKIRWDWKSDLNSVLSGPKFLSKDIESILKEEGFVYEKLKDEPEKVAELLEGGKFIGLFQGRMEYGPRALGNRSIVMDPSSEELRDELNERLGREPFQPFSPTILRSFMHTYLQEPDPNKFMTMSYHLTERGENDLKGAAHVDGTCRPQIIEREDNEPYYDIIDSFKERTQIGAVLNTSFNLHGEPIVCRPGEALRSFNKIGLDSLLIEDFLIKEF